MELKLNYIRMPLKGQTLTEQKWLLIGHDFQVVSASKIKEWYPDILNFQWLERFSDSPLNNTFS